MTPFQLFTSRLKRVSNPRTSKAGTSVRACCPACGGDNQSKLIVTEKSDGAVLLHCFAGCDALEVLNAVGFDLADLFPTRLKLVRGITKHPAHDTQMLIRIAGEAVCDAHALLLCFVEAMPEVPEMQAYLRTRISTLEDVRDLLILEVNK